MDQKEKENEKLVWKVTPAESRESLEISLLPYRKESGPPEGFDALISLDRIAVIEGDLLMQLRNMSRGGRDNLIKAAMHLEKELGGAVSRQVCLKSVKSIASPENDSRGQFAVPLSSRFWIAEKDLGIVTEEPGVTLLNHDGTKVGSQPRVDSKIEWPNSIPQTSSSEIDGDSMPSLPKSMFKSPPVQSSMGDRTARPSTGGGIKKISRNRR